MLHWNWGTRSSWYEIASVHFEGSSTTDCRSQTRFMWKVHQIHINLIPLLFIRHHARESMRQISPSPRLQNKKTSQTKRG
jgi:hypothetical protein